MDEQLTFFSATSSRPEIADLEGLLAGPGRLVRRPGAARVSVLVPAGWRCAALLTALAERALPGEAVLGEDAVPTVRTPFSPELLDVADRWTHGAVQGPPEHWQLTGPRLYCWAVAAGRHDEHGYLLSLGRNEESVVAVGAALHRAGLPGTLLVRAPAVRRTGSPAAAGWRCCASSLAPPRPAPDRSTGPPERSSSAQPDARCVCTWAMPYPGETHPLGSTLTGVRTAMRGSVGRGSYV